MIHPQEARISCKECNGWYNSESELYDHMRTAHRRCVGQKIDLQLGNPPLDSLKSSLALQRKNGPNFRPS